MFSLKGMAQVFVFLFTLVNIYFIVAIIMTTGHYHDFPNWVYPLVPNVIFSIILFIFSIPLYFKGEKKNLKFLWLVYAGGFIAVELLGVALP
jgi:uncharacterized membrane protein